MGFKSCDVTHSEGIIYPVVLPYFLTMVSYAEDDILCNNIYFLLLFHGNATFHCK